MKLISFSPSLSLSQSLSGNLNHQKRRRFHCARFPQQGLQSSDVVFFVFAPDGWVRLIVGHALNLVDEINLLIVAETLGFLKAPAGAFNTYPTKILAVSANHPK